VGEFDCTSQIIFRLTTVDMVTKAAYLRTKLALRNAEHIYVK